MTQAISPKDIDTIMTEDDMCALSEAEDDLKQGRTMNL